MAEVVAPDSIISTFRKFCPNGNSGLVCDVLRSLEPSFDEGQLQELCIAAGVSTEAPTAMEDLINYLFLVQPEVVFVLGGPGAGKGTFSTRIVEQFGYVHLSAGDLLREERKRPGSELGELIESRIKEGKLVPSEVTVALLEQEMKRQGWGGKYLIDGFPRSIDNYDAWLRLLGDKTSLKFCFLIDCSQQVMEDRLLNRGKTSGRADDNIETIRKRFVTFKEESLPVLTKLEQDGAFRKVNSDPGIDAVWSQVELIFGTGPEVVFVVGGPGSGKSTFSTRIVENFGYKHLSTGDLLRVERGRPGSELGELIENRIKEGKLVPSDVVVRLLEQEMQRQGWNDGKYLIDGFPRSMDNYAEWTRLLGQRVRFKFCFLIECSQEVMEQRLLNRGKTSGRSDDNIETIRKRFVTFKEESLPVLAKLENEGKCRKVNSDPGIDAVWHEVVTIFAPSKM